MPIFISYSRKDSAFVEVFAAKLVRNRHNVWLDKWELNVGDSLIDKIQSALADASRFADSKNANLDPRRA